MQCRLCLANEILKMSHIIPKIFIKYIKKQSLTKGLRKTTDPNIRLQDGEKVEFLCHSCEELFSKYETHFSNNYFNVILKNNEIVLNTDDDKLRYFLLSIAWRHLKRLLETDMEMMKTLSAEEINKLNEVLEHWRNILLEENLPELKSIKMHLIPTSKLSIFKNYPRNRKNNIGADFKIYGDVNSFKNAFTYIIVPYFMFCLGRQKSNG